MQISQHIHMTIIGFEMSLKFRKSLIFDILLIIVEMQTYDLRS